MQSLPFGLRCLIAQYNQDVFPEDCALIQRDYDELLEHAINHNRPGQLRVLLDCKECKDPKAVKWAAKNGHVECLQLLIDAKCTIDMSCVQLLLDYNCPLH